MSILLPTPSNIRSELDPAFGDARNAGADLLIPVEQMHGAYDVVLADPPWSYSGQQAKWGAAAKFYSTMSDEDLLDFTLINDLLAPRGVLFMWATSPRLDFAMRCLESWGLTYRGMAFVWVKTKKSDPTVPVGAQGVRPSVVKPTTEFVLVASRVRAGRPMRLADESVRQVVLAPKGEHSAKPVEVHERVEALYPQARRIELFARTRRPGWDAWGNQTPPLIDEDAQARSC